MGLSAQFFVAFDANMNNPGDQIYIDSINIVEAAAPTPTPTPLPTPTPTPGPLLLAADDLESGNLVGGSGWLDTWTTSGTVSATSAGTPQQGSFHMQVDKASEAKRSVDLSGKTGVTWSFQAKPSALNGGREAYAEASSDGIAWTTVRTWTKSDTQDVYGAEAIDLSPFTMTSQFWIRFSPNPPKEGVQRGPEETRKCSFASGIMVFERGNLPETRSTQQMLPLEHPDRIQIAFDDHRLVNNAGLLLPATLAQRVGLRELVDRYLDLGHAPGRANAGDKMLTLVASALAGGDCIDDADALRAGRTSSVLGCMVKAPSTLGTFLRSFRWGHVRQLDRVSRELLARAWAAGAGPGDGPLTIDLDSTICETYGLAKEGARHHGYTGKRGYHPLLAVAAGTGDVLMSRLREGRANTARGAAHFLRETVGRVRHAGAKGQLTVRADSGFYTHAVVAVCRKTKVRFSITIRQRASLRNLIEAIPEVDWTPIPYWMDGAADVAEAAYTPFRSKPDAAPVRLIVRRVKPTPGSQLALFASYSYHGFITDRDGDTLELEADHRRHAEVENAIRDLKYGVGLNHLPSGRFAANAAWLAVQVLAHNLARWAARIGLGEQLVTTKTLRRRFFSLAGRLTRSARRLTLHLPQGWPWAEQATLALARLRAIPLPA